MRYCEFQGKKLSALGFGAMRLPVDKTGKIDEVQMEQMVDFAMANGVNYFDTAWPYHDGESERVLGRMLSKYDRDSYYLATKYPGHQILSGGYNPAEIFEEQLKKCGVEYFDFYLLHNVYEKSMETYLDPRWGIIDYFKEQKRLGRIKHLGFSTHARTEALERFLDVCGEDMEFCQIQLNYLDWTLQDGAGKYELLTKRGIPVWVMEPVRGGKLANLSEDALQKLQTFRPEASAASWAFRFLQDLENVAVVLSGMSNQAQMEDNVKTFSEGDPLTEAERGLLLELAEGMKHTVPCTACRYCCAGCPMELDIPMLLETYNELKTAPATNSAMRIEFLPEHKKPSACIGCGKCERICPQNIAIPRKLSELTELLEKMPSWTEICRQREAAQAKK